MQQVSVNQPPTQLLSHTISLLSAFKTNLTWSAGPEAVGEDEEGRGAGEREGEEEERKRNKGQGITGLPSSRCHFSRLYNILSDPSSGIDAHTYCHIDCLT